MAVSEKKKPPKPEEPYQLLIKVLKPKPKEAK